MKMILYAKWKSDNSIKSSERYGTEKEDVIEIF